MTSERKTGLYVPNLETTRLVREERGWLRLAREAMIADSGEAHGRRHPGGIHVESLEGTGRMLRDRYRNADTSARTIDAPDARAPAPPSAAAVTPPDGADERG